MVLESRSPDKRGSYKFGPWTSIEEYRFLVGKPEEKRPQGRPRHRWNDNIKMHLSEKGWGGMD
jgi:hypothetical protein